MGDGEERSGADGRGRSTPVEVGSLRRLRSDRGLTQVALGRLLGMSQSEVSRLERRGDLRLSTLRHFVEATGGRLRLIAEYPEIRLTPGEAEPDRWSKDDGPVFEGEPPLATAGGPPHPGAR